MIETTRLFSELVRHSIAKKLIPGGFGSGLAVELPELPEFGDDHIVAVFWLTDGLVDSKSSFCQGSSIFLLQIELDILCCNKTVNIALIIIQT